MVPSFGERDDKELGVTSAPDRSGPDLSGTRIYAVESVPTVVVVEHGRCVMEVDSSLSHCSVPFSRVPPKARRRIVNAIHCTTEVT